VQPVRDGLGGHGDREADRHEVGHRVAEPAGVDADRPAPDLPDAFEHVGQEPRVHDPERTGREHDPEAVDEKRAEREQRDERDRVTDADVHVDPGEPDRDDGRSAHDLREVPELEGPQRDDHLCVLGLRQCEVELAVANLVGQLLHVRLDQHVHDSSEQDLDSEHHHQLRVGPAVQRRCVRIDERENDEADRDREPGLEDRHEEICAVLKLVQRAQPQVGVRELERPHQCPTAV
jgi:hypothetical protein